jgi:hypothetical protein
MWETLAVINNYHFGMMNCTPQKMVTWGWFMGLGLPYDWFGTRL